MTPVAEGLSLYQGKLFSILVPDFKEGKLKIKKLNAHMRFKVFGMSSTRERMRAISVKHVDNLTSYHEL